MKTKRAATEPGALSFIPAHAGLAALREAATGCRGCALYQNATQTVFGAGSATALVMFVGEQPGNDEDLAGKPFVGPAGRLLDSALVAAGIERADAYVTNVVKHFKWTARGKHRLHKKPSSREIAACLPWLEMEIELVKPRVLVCLGATAAQALLGREFKVTERRGELVPSPLAPHVMATVHPSSILRQLTAEDRRRELELFTRELKIVAALLGRQHSR